MITREAILAGCRAYVKAVNGTAWVTVHADRAERAARDLADGRTVPGLLTMTPPLLAALAAAVEADRQEPLVAPARN